MDILYILAWWLGMFYLGGVAFILLRPYFSSLSGQGYSLAKVIGLVGFSYLLWLLSSISIISYSHLSAFVVAAALGILALRQLLKGRLGHIPWRSVVIQEAIFSASFFIWSIVRSYNPRIEGVEKFMDIAVLQGLLRTEHFPPVDTWFAGEPLNYYYFGHLLISSLSKLTFVPGQIAFNLGLALVFALCIAVTSMLVYTLTSSKLAAGLSAFLLTLSSNLDPAIKAFQQTSDYIFFGATRLDPYTINEFPLYSFTVADLHAHTLGLPLALAIIGVLYAMFRSEKIGWPLEVVLILLLGATGPTNSFDLIIYGGLTGMILLLRAYTRQGLDSRALWSAVGRTFGIGLLAGLLYAPFYFNFSAPVGGVGIDLFKTPLWFILVNFGVLLFLSLPILLERISSITLPGVSLPKISLDDWFVWALIACGFLLIIGTEFFYLKDIYTYQNPPFARANTIFKVYYQVWVLLAIVAGFGLAKVGRLKLRWRLVEVYILGVGGLLALSGIGTWSALEAYANSKPVSEPTWTVDGFAYLEVTNPDQLALIDWMNTHISGQPTIVEAAGDSYTQDSRISSYTGLPSIIGWSSHEWGWRYSQTAWEDTISPRIGWVEQIYTTTDSRTVKQLLEEYDVDYVVVSPIERQKYGFDEESAIKSLAGEPVFEQGDYSLYKIP